MYHRVTGLWIDLKPSSLCDLTGTRAGSWSPRVEELGIQLQKKKTNSQHLETLKEEREGELEQQFKIIDALISYKATR